MTAILNAKKSRQDRETLPISSPIEHSTRYFLNDDFKKRQETTNFSPITGYLSFTVLETTGLELEWNSR